MDTAVSSTVTVVELEHSLVPSFWAHSVRRIGTSEVREASMTLSHAFAADAYTQYLVDTNDKATTAEQRWALHVDMMTYCVAACCMSGLVTVVGPEYDSVALWLPPGKDLDGWWTLLRSGMWRLYFQLSAEGKKRYFEECLPLLHDTKAAVLGDRDGDAYYLVWLGTKPMSQGRGYAKRLLEHMLEKADAEKRPVYLESSSLANNAYYKKFGFEVKKDIVLKRGEAPIRMSAMVREPQAVRKVTYTPAMEKRSGLGMPNSWVNC